MSMFQDPMAPKVPGVLGMSNTAAAMSEMGLGPRIGGAPTSPWAPAQVPTFMQQQPPAPQQAAPGGFWPSWLSPAPAPAAAPEAAAGPNLAIPGAMQAMMGGAPAWAMQMLFGGYAG
jgi:hypothetical protein